MELNDQLPLADSTKQVRTRNFTTKKTAVSKEEMKPKRNRNPKSQLKVIQVKSAPKIKSKIGSSSKSTP